LEARETARTAIREKKKKKKKKKKKQKKTFRNTVPFFFRWAGRKPDDDIQNANRPGQEARAHSFEKSRRPIRDLFARKEDRRARLEGHLRGAEISDGIENLKRKFGRGTDNRGGTISPQTLFLRKHPRVRAAGKPTWAIREEPNFFPCFHRSPPSGDAGRGESARLTNTAKRLG